MDVAWWRPVCGHADTPVPVTVALRGHTSRRESECTFPKLKVSVVDGSADVVSLLGGRRLKIGTHCGEATEDTLTAKFGRLPNGGWIVNDWNIRMPAIARRLTMSGGRDTLLGYRDGVAKVEMRGACGGCPSALMTLKRGVETTLKHYIPELQRVEAALQSDSKKPFWKSMLEARGAKFRSG